MPSQQLIALRARRLRRVLTSVSWFAIFTLLLVLGAIVVALTDGSAVLALVLVLAAVACAVLSLKET